MDKFVSLCLSDRRITLEKARLEFYGPNAFYTPSPSLRGRLVNANVGGLPGRQNELLVYYFSQIFHNPVSRLFACRGQSFLDTWAALSWLSSRRWLPYRIGLLRSRVFLVSGSFPCVCVWFSPPLSFSRPDSWPVGCNAPFRPLPLFYYGGRPIHFIFA